MARHPAPFLTHLADLRGPRPMDEGAAREPEVWLRGACKQQRRAQEVMAGEAAASGGCARAALRAETAA
eukprot:2866115-Pyramimonas_sp.AAC.1